MLELRREKEPTSLEIAFGDEFVAKHKKLCVVIDLTPEANSIEAATLGVIDGEFALGRLPGSFGLNDIKQITGIRWTREEIILALKNGLGDWEWSQEKEDEIDSNSQKPPMTLHR
jgi:hypothetical protein